MRRLRNKRYQYLPKSFLISFLLIYMLILGNRSPPVAKLPASVALRLEPEAAAARLASAARTTKVTFSVTCLVDGIAELRLLACC